MKRWGIVGGLVAIIVAAGAAGAWWYANEAAARQLRQTLLDIDFGNRVAYDSVTHNPLTGATVIHGIRTVGESAGGLEPKADAPEILDWQKENGLVQAVHVRVTDLQLNTEQAARAQFQSSPRLLAISFADEPKDILDNPLQALTVFGYQTVTLNGEFDYRYDPQAQSLVLAFALNGRNMGDFDLNLALAGVPLKLMQALAHYADRASSGSRPSPFEAMQMLSGLQQELRGVGLADFGWIYTDEGLFRRFKAYHDLQTVRFPGQPSTLEATTEDLEQAVAAATQVGLDPNTARAEAEALAAFARDPQRLVLRTRIDDPIVLAKLFDARRIPQAYSAPLQGAPMYG